MIKDLKKKFIMVALISVFALLFLVLGAINIVNFAKVTIEADAVLSRIEEGMGRLLPPAEISENVVGPDSPETSASSRYFTVRFSEEGEANVVSFEMSAVRPEDAVKWAEDELRGKKSGWTRTFYRFGSYTVGEEVFVSVLDFSRELSPSFTVLFGSVFGLIGGLLIFFIILFVFSDRIFSPMAKLDSSQEYFIAEAARELKTPLTVIALEKERIKEEFGESEATRSIDKQMKKLTELTLKLSELSFFDKADPDKKTEDISALCKNAVEKVKGEFEKRRISLNVGIEDGIEYCCDGELFGKMLSEIVDNGIKFSKTFFEFSLTEKEGRIKLVAKNDAQGLVDGDWDRVFERFYKASPESEGKGLGLSIVKAVVESHGGRVNAKADGGVFRIKIEF